MSLKNQLTTCTTNKLAKLFTGKSWSEFQCSTVKPVKPNFVLKYGPAASGKGSKLMNYTIESLGYNLKSYVNVNIDDAVESVPYYVTSSRNTLKQKVPRDCLNDPLKLQAYVSSRFTHQDFKNLTKCYESVRTGKNKHKKTIAGKRMALMEIALHL